MGKTIISPSILSSDFGNLRAAIKELDRHRVDRIHIDVMDGSFVPNITMGPMVIASIRKDTLRPFETHLMINNPHRHIASFADAGSDIIIVHYEAQGNSARAIEAIKSHGKKAGLSIKPKTGFSKVRKYLPDIDVLLIMTVNPGFGGQKFMPKMLKKIKEARRYIDSNGYRTIIAVDGGINLKTGKEAIESGANELIAGSAIFNSMNIGRAIKKFRNL